MVNPQKGPILKPPLKWVGVTPGRCQSTRQNSQNINNWNLYSSAFNERVSGISINKNITDWNNWTDLCSYFSNRIKLHTSSDMQQLFGSNDRLGNITSSYTVRKPANTSKCCWSVNDNSDFCQHNIKQPLHTMLCKYNTTTAVFQLVNTVQ